MSHLLELSFGPVQDFIAAARRTADLWAGSRLLSDAARAACQSLLDDGAQLIYPAPERVTSTRPQASNLSNVVLCRVDVDAERVRVIAQRAQTAASASLHSAGQDAASHFPELLTARLEAQLGDALEAYAAWAAIDADGYQAAYRRLKSVFAARKSTRDFSAWTWGAEGTPKNSLDGLRETVLPEGPARRKLARKLRLSDGEQLDALGAIKRLRGRENRFVALTRVAAHGWIQRLDGETLKVLRTLYEPLVGLDWATRVEGAAFADLPYDAALLYPERLEGARSEAAQEADDTALSALDALRDALRAYWRQYGRPCPYAALLVADGDQMGRAVDAVTDAQGHTALTRAIAAFADDALDVLAQHDGQPVYAGGEDVMGLLPLAQAVSCPVALEAAFTQRAAQLPVPADKRPTLRVGVVIAHVLAPLGDIRGWGQEAEKDAKGSTQPTGHALALKLRIRAGHDITLRMRFATEHQADFTTLDHWATLYRDGRLPARIGYDARAIVLSTRAAHYPEGVAEAELRRLLDRADASGGKPLRAEDKQTLQARIAQLREEHPLPEALDRFAHELIVARWLSARNSADLGRL